MRAPFLQTPGSVIDDVGLTDAALRFLQAMVKIAPRNRRNSDDVAKSLRMGKDKVNAARKCLRAHGHWHARKRQNPHGKIRDQRLASFTPLRTADEVAAGWAAADEAARLGKDTAESRRLGVRLLNSADWLPRHPVTGSPGQRPTRRRPPEGHKTEDGNQTPHPAPTPASEEAPEPAVEQEPAPEPEQTPGPELPPLDGPLAVYAERAETVLLQLRRTTPQLALPAADARELAQIAGHYLLREEGPETIRAVAAQGLPPEGVRSPRGFLRSRLLRYLPPLPDWPEPAPAPAPAATPAERAPAPEWTPPDPATRTPPRPGGPVDVLLRGGHWRAVLEATDTD